jgi:3-hydroxy-3-methylglutaryl CoA synthase/uncharacterized OB-fold protein
MSTTAIVGYGAYVPRYRLKRSDIAATLGTPPGRGARLVASYDEDSTSMAVEAARATLGGSRDFGALYFATTAPAYVDKTNAAIVHAALGLGERCLAADTGGAVRSATAALRAAALDHGLAVLADVRGGRPGSADERDGADAAVALAFGQASDEHAIAEILATVSISGEVHDRWRLPGESSSHTWEERFAVGFLTAVATKATAAALGEAGITGAPEHVVVSSPHTRAAAQVRRGFAKEAIVDGPVLAGGHAGTADIGLQLIAALDRAAPGDTILALQISDGCDALVLRVLPGVLQAPNRGKLAVALAGGEPVPYPAYLTWRGQLDREPPRRPEPTPPAGPPVARNASWKFGFVGSRCTACDHVHLPPQRVCTGCGVVDAMEDVRMADRPATVANLTVDRLAYSLAPPVTNVVLDFDGGGRFACQVADAAFGSVALGDRMDLTFRRLFTAGGFHNYFWKARPLGVAETGATEVAHGQ